MVDTNSLQSGTKECCAAPPAPPALTHEVRVREEVEEDRLSLLAHGRDEHLDEHCTQRKRRGKCSRRRQAAVPLPCHARTPEALEVPRLGRDGLDVRRRELAVPGRSRRKVLEVDGQRRLGASFPILQRERDATRGRTAAWKGDGRSLHPPGESATAGAFHQPARARRG